MASKKAEDSEAYALEQEALAGKNAQLLRPFIEAEDLKRLAFAYHFDADWYRRIALRWTRAGVITLISSALALLAINILAAKFQIPIAPWITFNAAACVVILYSVQLIGKQIVATREMIYAYSERARLIQIMDCADSLCESNKERSEVMSTLFSILASKLPSPFEAGRVADSANYDFLKDFSNLIHGKKKDAEDS